jgi:FMN-dependent oxidoreductase (nitrilotriacetate monooxygenase family)
MFHLIWFGTAGPSAWKTRAANIYDWRKSDIYMDVAKLCEKAKFDMVLLADNLAIPRLYKGSTDYYVESATNICHDPLPTIAMMGAATKNIGLGATISTTFYPPYLLARSLATLDHLTDGRIGWNMVTSTSKEAAQDFGMDELPEHDLRYEMGDEFLQVMAKLWESWEQDALFEEYDSKRFADPGKVHEINFEGRFYKCKGPLNVVPMPQGKPVTIVAGTSPRGLQFATRHAEMVIIHKNSITDIKEYSRNFRGMLEAAGRDPRSCKISTAIKPLFGESELEAREKWEAHYENASIDFGLAQLSLTLGYDMSQFDLDTPLPKDLQTKGIQGKLTQFGIAKEAHTLREIAKHEGMHETLPIYGTPEHVADVLEQAATEGDIDAFHFRHIFGSYEYLFEVATKLVPVLQKRGLVRKDYSGNTLRHHLFEF